MVSLVADERALRSPGVPLLLFGDQCSGLTRAGTLEHAIGRGVSLFFLVSSSSRFLQPLNAAPFRGIDRMLWVTTD